MKNYLKTTGPLEVGLWASHDLYTSVAALKANYRAPDGSTCDHEVSLVGYCDDATCPTGGYWIIKNSWGTGEGQNGYDFVPYGNIEIHNDISAITGAVYYTGAMATAIWQGGPNPWTAGGNSWSAVNQYGNSIPVYAWENKETLATFNMAGGKTNISGMVIAHGVVINSGATNYTFLGGSLTITGGGIAIHESATFNVPITIGAPQTWTIDTGKNLTVGAVHTIITRIDHQQRRRRLRGRLDRRRRRAQRQRRGCGKHHAHRPWEFQRRWGRIRRRQYRQQRHRRILSLDGSRPNHALVGNPQRQWHRANSQDRSRDGRSEQHQYLWRRNLCQRRRLQADNGVGLPNKSFLYLDGGVLQSNSAVATTFSRSMGTSGSGKFEWTSLGGGFSAGLGPLNVNIGGAGAALGWGTTAGTNIMGPLNLNSPAAQNVVTFVNGINLNGVNPDGTQRTIVVNRNSADTISSPGTDYAVISGVIADGSNVFRLYKNRRRNPATDASQHLQRPNQHQRGQPRNTQRQRPRLGRRQYGDRRRRHLERRRRRHRHDQRADRSEQQRRRLRLLAGGRCRHQRHLCRTDQRSLDLHHRRNVALRHHR